MEMDDILSRILQIQHRLMASLPDTVRPYLDALDIGDRGALIVGPRGVGKTYFLLKTIKNRHGLYVSLDNPMARTAPLYELIEAAALKGYENIFLDEVHYSQDWALHLKAAYDAFPQLTIWASDSSSVVLRRGVADLSRRFPITHIPLMSLREFIALREGTLLPTFNPFDGDSQLVSRILKQINVLKLFAEYMQFGFRPFFLEETSSYLDKIINTINKSIEADIPYLIPRLTDNHFRLMQAVIAHLGGSVIPRISVNAMCGRWHLSKEKLHQLISVLERAHVLRIIRKKNDRTISSLGAKMFLFEPSAYYYFTEDPGTRREAYVTAAAMASGFEVWATKDEREGDFIIDDTAVEVGGRNKKKKGADVVIRDDTDVLYDDVIPMWTFGMTY
ncbi:MAG: AAA family ATPase [Myxococcota bacterium]|nr:AAA family ATPase [Myxococcota bacterium]